jgi:hypothetical protein
MAGARAGRTRLRALAERAVGPPIGLAPLSWGRPGAALTHVRPAVAAEYRGLSLRGVGRPAPALGQFRPPVRLEPSNAPAQANLAALAGADAGPRP